MDDVFLTKSWWEIMGKKRVTKHGSILVHALHTRIIHPNLMTPRGEILNNYYVEIVNKENWFLYCSVERVNKEGSFTIKNHSIWDNIVHWSAVGAYHETETDEHYEKVSEWQADTEEELF